MGEIKKNPHTCSFNRLEPRPWPPPSASLARSPVEFSVLRTGVARTSLQRTFHPFSSFFLGGVWTPLQNKFHYLLVFVCFPWGVWENPTWFNQPLKSNHSHIVNSQAMSYEKTFSKMVVTEKPPICKWLRSFWLPFKTHPETWYPSKPPPFAEAPWRNQTYFH